MPTAATPGFNKVSRASVFADGKVTYWMQCNFMNSGPLRNRFEVRDFKFAVDDQGNDRIYLGPDFYGAGHPYGSLVDSHYYSPGWRADLNTMNQILADGVTQVYSSLLYEGPTLFAVFNGVYLNAHDYDTNPDTKSWIDGHLEAERELAVLALHRARPGGRSSGPASARCSAPTRSGRARCRCGWRNDPIDLVRAEVTSWRCPGRYGLRALRFIRSRSGRQPLHLRRPRPLGQRHRLRPSPLHLPAPRQRTLQGQRPRVHHRPRLHPGRSLEALRRRPHDRHSLRPPHLHLRRLSAALPGFVVDVVTPFSLLALVNSRLWR